MSNIEETGADAGSLLTKMRRINRLLQSPEGLGYEDLTRVLSGLLAADVCLVRQNGSLEAYAAREKFFSDADWEWLINRGELPQEWLAWLSGFDQTAVNEMFTASEGSPFALRGEKLAVAPVVTLGNRVGILMAARREGEFSNEDAVIVEHGANAAAVEARQRLVAAAEEEKRQRGAVTLALKTLSYSEVKAAVAIMKALDGAEGILVTSQIADNSAPKITRSVIVNTLRKFGSAGLVETKSLGSKGTYLALKNEYLKDEIMKLESPVRLAIR